MRPMRPWLLTAAIPLLLLSACSQSTGTASTSPSPSPETIASPSPSPEPSPTPPPSPTPIPSPPPSLAVAILSSDYGLVTAQTVQGATCNLRAILPGGKDAPGVQNPMVAGSGGHVHWDYPQYPVTYQGTGTHLVSCTYNGLGGTASANFGVGS